MKRATRLLATLGLLLIPPLLLAQDLQSPTPPSSSDIFGPELIAWSQQQKPQPVPQPLPDPAGQQETGTANAEAQQPAVQAFMGRIVKDGNRYVLQVSSDRSNDTSSDTSNDTRYQLDDQQKASQYEGKQVKLLGTLDL